MDNFSLQDKTWAKVSTLDVGVFYALHLFYLLAKQSKLKLKTWPKQLLGSLPLAIALPAQV
jgi:hypothetical protein